MADHAHNTHRETFKEKLIDRNRSHKTELKQNLGIAGNRLRGSMNILKRKGTLAEKFERLDAFNARTQGVLRKKKKPLDLFKKK